MKLKGFIKGQLFTTILLFSFGQLGRVSFFDDKATVYLYEIALVSLVFLLINYYKLEPLKYFVAKYRGTVIFLAIVTVTFLLSLFRYSAFDNFVAFLYLLRVFTYFTFFAYFLHFTKKEPDIIPFIKLPLLIFAAIAIVTAILQYFLYPDLRNLFYLGWDPHLYRVFGTFLEPVIAATIYGFFMIFLYFNPQYFRKKLVSYFGIIIFFILLVLTYTRSAILGVSVTTLFQYMRKNLLYGLVFIFIIGGMLLVIPKKSGEGVNLFRTSTIYSRSADLQAGLQLAAKNTFLGIGYNHIRFEKKSSGEIDHAAAGFQSSFLIILVTSGIFGLASFIYMLYELGKRNAFTASLIIYAGIISLFDNVFLHPFILFVLFIMLGLTTSPSRTSR